MPNTFTSTGMTTATRAELISNFVSSFQTIYGADINTDPDSPDGQLINIFVQALLDAQDLMVQVNNNFDPDLAFGTILDQRVAINGIQRQIGTYSYTPITVTTGAACTLQGLDLYPNTPFTVSDSSGNQWYLAATVSPSVGVNSYQFRAANTGAITTILNTIVNITTIVLGVLTVNNPSVLTTLGTNEETDSSLKIRRQKSVALPSQGYLAGLLGAIENVTGVTAAFVYENNTDSTVVIGSDSIPSHSIWVIVAGTFAASDVATAIYSKRNAGCGMYGSVTYNYSQIDGTTFVVRWDDVVEQPLYISFNAHSLNGVTPPNTTAILAQLPGLFVPGVNAEVNINQLATLVQQIDPNTLVIVTSGSQGFSTTGSGGWANYLSPTSYKNQFVVSSPNISITIV